MSRPSVDAPKQSGWLARIKQPRANALEHMERESGAGDYLEVQIRSAPDQTYRAVGLERKRPAKGRENQDEAGKSDHAWEGRDDKHCDRDLCGGGTTRAERGHGQLESN
jgi:hypothetical protein